VKILSVVSSILSDTATNMRIRNIARLLCSLGHEVHLVQYIRKRWDGNRFNLTGVSHSVVFVSMYTAHLRHLRELCKDDYDLVYGNTHEGTFLSLLAKTKRVPLIFDMHGGLVEEFLLANDLNFNPKIAFNFFLSKFIDIMNVRFSDKIVCVSKKMIKYLHEQKGVLQEKLAYITNGVDLEFFKPADDEKVRRAREHLGIEDKLVFGYIGGFQKWQGAENFKEAARKTNNRKVAFLIVGGNKEQIEKKNNIIFIPRVPHTQVSLYYSMSDVLVLPRPGHPATEIAAPTKFAEYVAMNKPVLVTNVGDAADLTMRYNCGIVVKDNAVKSLIKGIQEFRGKSEKELNEMGRNSRRLAENEFDWSKVKDNLRKLIQSI